MAPSASHMLCCRRWTRLLGRFSDSQARRARVGAGDEGTGQPWGWFLPGGADDAPAPAPQPQFASPPRALLPRPPRRLPAPQTQALLPLRAAQRWGPRPPRASGLAPPPRRSGRQHLAARLPWVRTMLSSQLPLPPRTGWSRDPRPDASVLAALQGSRSKQPRFYLSAPSRWTPSAGPAGQARKTDTSLS